MKHFRFFLPLALAAILIVASQHRSFADLTASQVVSQFNGLNGGVGFKFNAFMSTQYYGELSGETRLQKISGTETPDLSAYTSNTSNTSTGYFQSFCVEPEETLYTGVERTNVGTLNFSGNSTSTSSGDTMNLGIAYLYKEFANGSLAGYNYTYGTGRAASAGVLQDAIWFLLGKTEYLVNTSTSWATNAFLQKLTQLDSNTANWLAQYNPDSNYSVMGDNKVFVITVIQERQQSGGIGPMSMELVRQDLLYVAKGGGGVVPEPASLLLWAFGSVGLAGVAYRKRLAKKDA